MHGGGPAVHDSQRTSHPHHARVDSYSHGSDGRHPTRDSVGQTQMVAHGHVRARSAEHLQSAVGPMHGRAPFSEHPEHPQSTVGPMGPKAAYSMIPPDVFLSNRALAARSRAQLGGKAVAERWRMMEKFTLHQHALAGQDAFTEV